MNDFFLTKGKAFKIVGLSRTVLYRPKVDRMEREVIAALNEILSQRSLARWGFGKCFDRMRLDGYRSNHKLVHRVYCEMKLNMQRRKRNVR